MSAVPAVPCTGLRIIGDRIRDFGCCVYRVAVDLVVSTNLAKGSYVIECTVRTGQVNRTREHRLGCGGRGALKVVARVVTSWFRSPDVSQREGNNQTSEIFDNALISTEEKAHGWS